MPILTLPQIGRRLKAARGQKLLDAALDAGIPFPHSCRSGRCGACKSHLIEGSVTMATHTRFALTEKEQTQGLILACRAVPDGDVTVAWIDGEDAVPAHRIVSQAAKVISIDAVTHDIRRILLALEDRAAFTFSPGQYIRLSVDGAPPRDYSLANLPGSEHLELHIRAVPGGRASTRITQELRIGDRVRIDGPFGSAFLREKHRGPIIAVAGGSGLAPIKSIVGTALREDPSRRVHIYFGGRSPRDVYLADHFRSLVSNHPNATYHAILSDVVVPGWRSGYVSDAMVEDHARLEGAKVYAAGPPPMIDAVYAAAQSLGVEKRDVHSDIFFTPSGEAVKVLEEVQP